MSRFSKLPVSLATGLVLLGLTVLGGVMAGIADALTPCCGLGGFWPFVYSMFLAPILGLAGLVLTVIGLISKGADRSQKEDV